MTAGIIEQEPAPAALSDQLQGIARRYVAARQRTNEAFLEAAAALAEARAAAQHGEWYTFLEATSTTQDLADKLLAIHAESQRSPQFAETVARGWLPMSQAAIVARPSTPPEAKERVIEQAKANAAAQQPPPSKREVERTVQAARPASSPPAPNPAPVRDLPAAPQSPAAPAPLTPMAPLTPLAGLTPLPAAAPAAAGVVEEVATVARDHTALYRSEALVALLDQALTLAQSENARIRRELDAAGVVVEFPDPAVELAARTFVDSPAVRGAATFLAMSAREG